MVDVNSLPLDETYRELTRAGAVHRLMLLARDEDLGPGGAPGDVTSRAALDEERVVRATVAAREAGVLAGGRAIDDVLRVFAPRAKPEIRIEDGNVVKSGDVVAMIEGPAPAVLAAERTLLNLVGRLSGVATRTRKFVEAIAGLPAKILDTRKTTPGLRALEKYAVRCGGGFCHRAGLHDAVLIKDNHLAGISVERLANFVRGAMESARAQGSRLAFMEAEVDSLEQFQALLAGGLCAPNGIDIVLLDNMPPERLREAVAMRAKHGANVLLEASGGVRLENVRAIAETGVDRISVGGLTHQAVSLDFGMDAQP